MNNGPTKLPPIAPNERTPSPEQTLRRLFMTLFLRGRTSRGLRKDKAPTSIGRKLFWTLAAYAMIGLLFSVALWSQPIFALSAYLHAMTFMFAGMFIASSAGEILFNREEADILLHRPVAAKSLLWAKIRVLIEVSLYLAIAFNLAGLFVGAFSPQGSWRFVPVHLFSIVLESMFCCGCVVLVYQLCLRWFGRERLEGLMTTFQVVLSLAAVLGGQIVPQLMIRSGRIVGIDELSAWIALLPPAWFAGIDDLLAGEAARQSWRLAALASISTPVVLWLAFAKLAGSYESGLQMLNETITAPKRTRVTRRWLDRLIDLPPLRWWLRDPVARASFLLTAAYLVRDRDVKLRIYPGIAPMLAMPFMFLLPSYSARSGGPNTLSGFGVAFAAGYIGLVPFMGLSMLQFSQHWQAADIFRVAPIAGPARLCHGARRAALLFLTLPVLVVFAAIVVLLRRDGSELLLMLPGAISLPVFALLPNLGGRAVPLSMPNEEAKSVGRGLMMMAVIPLSMMLSGLAMFAWATGWFWWFVLAESFVVAVIYYVLRRSVDGARWPSME